MRRFLSGPVGFLLVLLAVFPAACLGQAWPQGHGTSYLKLSQGRITAAEQYTFSGQTKPYADHVDGEAFFDRSFYVYGEYGLTDQVTLVGMVPYKRLRVMDAAFAYESGGIGSVMLGLRVGLKPLLGWSTSRHALALNTALTLPAGYTRNYAPAIGAGQADAQAILSWGLSLYPLPFYAQAGGGYRYRSNLYLFSQAIACQPGRDLECVRDVQPDYTDEWLFAAEVGASLGPWALLQVLTQGVWSVAAPTATTSFTANNPIPTRQRYVKAGLGLSVYPIPQIGLSAQYYTTPYGRNTIRSQDWFFGIEYIRR